MTILWTAAAIHQVLADKDSEIAPTKEIQYMGVTMLVTPLEDGFGRIERLISPNPQHFLRAEFQPGMRVPMYTTHEKNR
jgi:hypothetical protein